MAEMPNSKAYYKRRWQIVS